MAGWNKTKVVLDSQFCFGKYGNTPHTIKWIIDNDIDYITWALDEGLIKFDKHRRPAQAKEAEDYYNSKINKT